MAETRSFKQRAFEVGDKPCRRTVRTQSKAQFTCGILRAARRSRCLSTEPGSSPARASLLVAETARVTGLQAGLPGGLGSRWGQPAVYDKGRTDATWGAAVALRRLPGRYACDL